MTMRRKWKVMAACVLGVGAAAAQQPVQVPGVPAACAAVEKAEVPAADRPSSTEAAAFRGCRPLALFYGIGGPQNAVQARKCAWLAYNGDIKWKWMDWAWSDDVGPTEPGEVLAHVYATGAGVPRNFDVALHYACHLTREKTEDIASTDEELVSAILKIKAVPEKPVEWPCTAPFRWCGDLTVALDAEQQQRTENKFLARLTPGQRQAYLRAGEAYDSYRDAEQTDAGLSAAGDEDFTDQSGKDWMDQVQAAELKRFPDYTHAQALAADAELNRVYAKAMAAAPAVQQKKDANWNEVMRTRTDLRATERAWIAYRDAWFRFATLRYPAVSAQAWTTMLTVDRIQEIGSDADLTDIRLSFLQPAKEPKAQ